MLSSAVYKITILFTAFFSIPAVAAPGTFTYQGRIVQADGTPLENQNVAFEFSILSPDGSCVLYREQRNNVDMRNSKGLFDTPIGSGNRYYPTAASANLLDAFSNAAPMTCEGGATYSPQVDHGRVLRVQFFNGSTWRLITPDSIIRSVPFSAYAMGATTATKLGIYAPTDFVLKDSVNAGASCGSGSFLTWDGTTKSFGCALGSTGSGTVTQVTSANSYLTVTNNTTTPLLTLNVGTGANTLAAGNDSRFTNSRTPTGTAGGDLSGDYPNPTVAKIQGVGIDFAIAPSNGQVLKFDGTNWIAATLPAASNGTVTGITAGTGLTGGTISTTGTIGLGTELSGVNAVSSTGYIQRTGAGAYSTTAGSISASNNNLVLRDGSGVSSFYGVGISGATSGTLTLQMPTISTNYALTFPSAQGGANQVLANDGAGILSWQNIPLAPGADCGTGNVVTYNGTAFTCVPDQVGSSGGGIVTINSQAGSAQTFANGTTGTQPNWVSASDVHTLHIPLAAATGVMAGLISKAQYDAFNGKQAALGFTPLNPANNLSELTASATTARANLGLGTASTKTAPASGNAAAAEVVLGNDTRLTDGRPPSGTAAGDLSGTYPNPTVAKINGISLAYTSIASGQYLKYNGTNWINSAIATADITGLSTSLNNKIDQSQISGTCSPKQTFVFSSVTGTWTCTDIAIDGTQVTYASQTAKTFLAAPTAANGAPSFRAIASTDLPSTITDAAWTAASGNVYRLTGNVGIGTASPTSALHVLSTNPSGIIVERASVINSGIEYKNSGGSMYAGIASNLNFSIGANANLNTGSLQVMPSGYVGIGVTDPTYKLTVAGSNYVASSVLIQRNENGGAGPGLDFRSSRGTSGVASSQTLINQEIGQLNFYGTNEAGNIAATASAGIRAIALENTTATSAGGGIGFRTTQVGANSLTEKMRLSDVGNLGIGTTDPKATVHIQGSTPRLTLFDSDTAISANSPAWSFRASDGTNGKLIIQSSPDYVTYNDRMTFDKDGNVGIGTTSPAAKFHTVSNGANTLNTTATVMYAVSSPVSTVTGSYEQSLFSGYTNPIVSTSISNSGNAMGLNVNVRRNNTGSTTADDGGTLSNLTGANILYGHSADNSSASPTTVNTYGIYLNPTNNTGVMTNHYGLYMKAVNGSAPVNNFAIYIADTTAKSYFAGNVGVGTTNPGAKLEVNSGAANAATGFAINTTSVGANTYASFKANGTIIGSISSTAGANVVYNTTSDVRLKGGFHQVNAALDKVQQIEVSNFYYLADPQHSRMDGFKAQQLYAVLPYAVTKPEKETDEEGHVIPWLADYSKVVPLVTAAVKELYQKVLGQDEKMARQAREIASLKNENAIIKSDNAAIRARLQAQENELKLIRSKLGL